jgi:hypothetical protein
LELETPRATELWLELRSCEREGLASIHYEVHVTHPKPGFPAVLILQDLPAGRYVFRGMVKESESDLPVTIALRQWP